MRRVPEAWWLTTPGVITLYTLATICALIGHFA